MCNEYNGWPNYPTWNVYLWLTSEEPTYNHCREMASTFVRDLAHGNYATTTLAHNIEEMVENTNPMTTGDQYQPSMYADILGWALDSVDWYRIAQAFLEEIHNA